MTYVVGDLEDLQLEVYNFQLLRLCSSVVVVMRKANRRFKPYSRLLLPALSSFHFFSAPAGPSGGRTGHTTRAQLRRITSLCT